MSLFLRPVPLVLTNLDFLAPHPAHSPSCRLQPFTAVTSYRITLSVFLEFFKFMDVEDIFSYNESTESRCNHYLLLQRSIRGLIIGKSDCGRVCVTPALVFSVVLCVLCLFLVSFCWPWSCLSSDFGIFEFLLLHTQPETTVCRMRLWQSSTAWKNLDTSTSKNIGSSIVVSYK